MCDCRPCAEFGANRCFRPDRISWQRLTALSIDALPVVDPRRDGRARRRYRATSDTGPHLEARSSYAGLCRRPTFASNRGVGAWRGCPEGLVGPSGAVTAQLVGFPDNPLWCASTHNMQWSRVQMRSQPWFFRPADFSFADIGGTRYERRRSRRIPRESSSDPGQGRVAKRWSRATKNTSS